MKRILLDLTKHISLALHLFAEKHTLATGIILNDLLMFFLH